MQQELLSRQRDEARDEAATLRTGMRKAKKDKDKGTEELVQPLQAEIKSLNEMLAQKNNALRESASEVEALQRDVAALAAKIPKPGEVKVETVIEYREPPKPEMADAETEPEEAWPERQPTPEPVEIIKEVIVEKIVEVEKGTDANLMGELKELRGARESLTRSLTEEGQRREAAESERDSAKAQIQPLQNLVAEIDPLKAEIKKLQDSLSERENALGDRLIELEQSREGGDTALKDALDELKATKEELQNVKAELERAKQEAADAVAKAAAEAADAAGKTSADDVAAAVLAAQDEVLQKPAVLTATLGRIGTVAPEILRELIKASPQDTARSLAIELLGLMDPAEAGEAAQAAAAAAAKAAAAEAEILRLTSALDESNKEVDRLKQRIEELKDERNQARSESTAAQRAGGDAGALAAELQGKINELEEKLKESEAAREASDKEGAELAAGKASAENERDAANKRIGELDAKIVELEEELEKAKEQFRLRDADVIALQQELQRRTGELQETIGSERAVTPRAAALPGPRPSSREVKSCGPGEYVVGAPDAAEWDTTIAATQEAISVAESLAASRPMTAPLQEPLEPQRDWESELNAANEALKEAESTHRKESQKMAARIAELEERANHLKERLDEAQQQRKEALAAAADPEEAAKLLEKLTKLEGEAREAREEAKKAREEMKDAQRQCKIKHTLLFMANQGKQNMRNRGDTAIQTLCAELEELDGLSNALALMVKDLQGEVIERRWREVQAHAAWRITSQAVRRQKDNEMKKLSQSEKNVIAANNINHKNAMEKKEAELEGVREMLREMTATAEEAAVTVGKLEQRIADMGKYEDQSKGIASTVLSETRDELARVKEELAASRKETASVQTDLDSMTSERDGKERERQALDDKLSELKQAHASANASLNKASELNAKQKGDLEHHLEDLNASMDALRAQLNERDEAIVKLQSDLKESRKALDSEKRKLSDTVATGEESKKSEEAENLIRMRLMRAFQERRLKAAQAELASMSAKVAALGADASAARATAAAEKARTKMEMSQIQSGSLIAATWWRKKVQLARVRAIYCERQADGKQQRIDELEKELATLRESATLIRELEAAKEEVINELGKAREALQKEANLKGEEVARCDRLLVELDTKGRAHEAAVEEIAALKTELLEALPLAGWKQQAEDVVQKNTQLHQEIEAVTARTNEFAKRLDNLQTRLLAEEASASPAVRTMLQRMAEKQKVEADAWGDKRRQLERLREANWLKGISTLGLMMAGGHDVNSSDGTFNPPTSRAIINLDFYNRQSTTVNRRIYEPPPTAPTSSTRRGRDGSPPRSTSPPFMKPPSPPQPGQHPPLNPPAVDLAPAPEMAPLQPQQQALVESGAPAVPSSTPEPLDATGQRLPQLSQSLGPAGRSTLPQLVPESNLSGELTHAMQLIESGDGSAGPEEAAGAMGALFEAAVRLAWGSSPRSKTASTTKGLPSRGALRPSRTASGARGDANSGSLSARGRTAGSVDRPSTSAAPPLAVRSLLSSTITPMSASQFSARALGEGRRVATPSTAYQNHAAFQAGFAPPPGSDLAGGLAVQSTGQPVPPKGTRSTPSSPRVGGGGVPRSTLPTLAAS